MKLVKSISDKACLTEDDLLKSITNEECTACNAQPFVVVTPTTPNNHVGTYFKINC